MNPNFFREFRQEFSLRAHINEHTEMAKTVMFTLMPINALLALMAYINGINAYILAGVMIVDAALIYFAYWQWRVGQELQLSEADTRLNHREYARLVEVRDGFPELADVYRRHLGVGRELTYGDVWAFCRAAHKAYSHHIFESATQAGAA